MNREEKLQSLLKLKRNEMPGDAYFEAFTDEFHRYQRAEVLEERKSWFFRWKRAFNEGLDDMLMAPARLVQGSAAALGIVILSAILFVAHLDSDQVAGEFVESTSVYVDGTEFNASSETDQAELAMAHLSSFENDFKGSTYVTGGATLSNDSVITF